jgi:hypothetical protein
VAGNPWRGPFDGPRFREQLEGALPAIGEEGEQRVDPEELEEERQLSQDRLSKADAGP